MLTSSDAAHLLRRVGFAGTDAEIQHFTGMSRAAAVSAVLNTASPMPGDPSYIHVPEWWTRLNDLKWWWLQRMIDGAWINRSGSTPNPLVEKLSLFWHSHFSSGVHKVEDLSAMFYQNQLFRQYGMGDFETLLDKVCGDEPLGGGALLRYLDNDTNDKDNPQENFARELMELYTIGPDEFTENDVIEMARAWTGHGIVGWVGYWDATYQFRSERHDYSNKALFGLPLQNWDGPATINELVKGVKRQATARFLATKLWRFFVNDSPSTSTINSLVATFSPTMDIEVLLEAIFMHDDFWNSKWALTRSPIETIVDVCRRTGITAQESNVQWLMAQMGQEIFEPPSVAGWGTSGYWVSTMGAWGRTAFLTQIRWNSDVQANFDGIMDEPNAAAGAQMIIDVLGLADVSNETRTALEEFWTDHDNTHRWAAEPNAVVIGGMTPEFLTA